MADAAKSVLITAGASGIGRVIAEAFLAQGHQVHVCDISAEAIAALRAEQPLITSTLGDVSVRDQVDQLFVEFKSLYGQLDVLVNNVGIAGPTAALEDIDPDDWDHTINVDLNSLFYVSRQAAPLLKISKGCMINMASNAALFGFPLRSAYAAAKWATIGLTKTWAMELGPFGVRVNALCPGSVSGPRIERVIAKDAEQRGVSEEAIRNVYQRQNSLRVFVEAEEIAQTILFLCSSAGRNISGQAIPIDGHTEGLSNWLE